MTRTRLKLDHDCPCHSIIAGLRQRLSTAENKLSYAEAELAVRQETRKEIGLFYENAIEKLRKAFYEALGQLEDKYRHAMLDDGPHADA